MEKRIQVYATYDVRLTFNAIARYKTAVNLFLFYTTYINSLLILFPGNNLINVHDLCLHKKERNYGIMGKL